MLNELSCNTCFVFWGLLLSVKMGVNEDEDDLLVELDTCFSFERSTVISADRFPSYFFDDLCDPSLDLFEESLFLDCLFDYN